MGLTMVLLASLSYFFRETDAMNSTFERLRKQGFEISYLENRLSKIVPKAVMPNDKKKDYIFISSGDGHGLFKSGSSNLLFTFDSGVEVDKAFANHVLGRLYLTKEGELTLAIWPSYARWENKLPQMKKEVLLGGVENVQFEFYVPPPAFGAKITEREVEPKNFWHKEWKQEYKKLPAMVRMTVHTKGESMIFVFPIVNSDNVIHYDI